jgi:catechol 2,3-dioxygenase-like lactoylglutathione lyase family enzyme
MYRIGTTQVWVHDQDEAREFYTTKLGMELRSDVSLPEMGGFRWLTVGPPGQDDLSIVLMAVPGPPVYDPETSRQISVLLAKGGTSTVFLVTDDCQKTYEELSSRGVEFQEAPEQRPYGIDAGFRDPSGNNFRLTQVTDLG